MIIGYNCLTTLMETYPLHIWNFGTPEFIYEFMKHMNSYMKKSYEFIVYMNSYMNSYYQIYYIRIIYMNSYTYEFIYEMII